MLGCWLKPWPACRHTHAAIDCVLDDGGRFVFAVPHPCLPFMREQRVFEIDSSIILQPGPGALTAGVSAMHRLLASVTGGTPAAAALKDDPWGA